MAGTGGPPFDIEFSGIHPASMTTEQAKFAYEVAKSNVQVSGLITEAVVQPEAELQVDTLPYVVALEKLNEAKQELNNYFWKENKKVCDQVNAYNYLKGDQKMLEDQALKYGQHEEDCAYIEQLGSGRLIDVEDSCSCGWKNFKEQLKQRVGQREGL